MNKPLLRNFNLLAQAFAVFAIGAGVLSILGWLPGLEIFEGSPNANMKLLTAISCIFLGATVFHSVLPKSKRRQVYILLPYLAFFLGAISLCNYYLQFMDRELTRTAPISGATIVLLSLTLIFRNEGRDRFTALSEFFTLGAIFILFPAVIGYLYGVERLYSLTAYSRMSFLSTIALCLLSVSVLLTMPKQKFTSFFYSESHVGRYYRKWFLLFFIAPIIAGWVYLQGYERGAFDLRFALALVVITNIFFSLVVSWFWTNRLYKASQVVEFQNSELRESEKRFRDLAESMPQFVWSTDSNGRMDYMNERFSDFVGFACPVAKEAWDPIISREYKDSIDQHWRTAIAKSSNFEVEFKMLDRKSGMWRWFLARGVPAFGKNGQVTKWFGTTTDIHEHKVIQENLKISKNRLASIIHQGPLAIQIVSQKGDVVQVNESWKKLYAVSDLDLEKMLLSGYNAFTDPVLNEVGIVEMSKRALNGEFIFVPETEVRWDETENHPAKTAWIETWISPIRNVTGEVSELCITINDVSDRKRADDEIHARQSELQAILDNSPAVIYMKDLNGKIILINNVFKEIFRGTEADFIGKYNEEIWPMDVARKLVENDLKVATTKIPLREEELVPHYDGVVHTYLSTKFPVFDSDGKVRAICGISTDITDNKQKEKERAELEVREKLAIESSRLKSEFLANMSHEIRTPINGIIGMTKLLSDTSLNPEQKNYARAITKSSSILLTLINDILDLSKVESGKLELELIPFSFDELIHDTKESFLPIMESKKIKLEVNGGSSGRYFLGDPGRIRQILNNLIGNALKFTSHGEIRLDIRVIERPKQLSEVHFSISDTGVGISEEKIGSLFQKFFQVDSSTARKYGGTGLGLVICKQLVEMMKGSIGVKSKLGVGSEFYFDIKLEPINAENFKTLQTQFSTDQIPLLTPEMRKGARVLVADDNAINQEITVKMLENSGYKADAVANGAEVLNAIANINYDLILMDCQMPEMDGYQATKIIREKGINIPVVALTANAYKEDREKCIEAGMSDYIAKPIQQEKLLRIVDGWVGQSVMSSGLQRDVSSQKPAATDLIIDIERIRDLSSLDHKSPDLLKRLIKLYIESMPSGIEDLRKIAAGGQGDLKKKAHALKSPNMNLGAIRVVHILEEIESGKLPSDQLAKSLDELDIKVKEVQEALVKYLNEIGKKLDPGEQTIH